MSISAQPAATRLEGPPAGTRNRWRHWSRPLLGLLPLALLLGLLSGAPAPTPAATPPDHAAPVLDGPQRFALTDGNGERWSLSLFEQPDPAYPDGWRLRLNALTPGLRPDHQRPLPINDGAGGQWTLENRSQELVAQGSAVLPDGSAQFDLAALVPSPADVLPLQLTVPLADGHHTTILLGAEPTGLLHQLDFSSEKRH